MSVTPPDALLVSVIGHVKDSRRAHDRGRALCRPGRAAVRRYPLLAGTYTELHAMELTPKEQHKDPADQQRFVTNSREQLARAIERGEPLTATRVPARDQMRASNSRQERDLVQEWALN
jgi:hypothetical protein